MADVYIYVCIQACVHFRESPIPESSGHVAGFPLPAVYTALSDGS
jgi:hypothetical protein